MRLLKLRLTNFRRFGESQTLDLNETLIALVGPNEAGKTTVLRALDLLGHLDSPTPRDRTRGGTQPATIDALFVLEPADEEAIATIHGADVVKHAWVRLAEGAQQSTWTLENEPRRDLAPRQRCADLIGAIAGDPALDARFSVDPERPWDPELFNTVLEKLSSDGETLVSTTLEQVEDLAGRIRSLNYSSIEHDSEDPDEEAEPSEEDIAAASQRENAASALVELLKVERAPRPFQLVINALAERLPEIAFFTDADRELSRDYTLADVAAEPPAALANLCAVADLDLTVINDHVASGRTAEVEKLFEDANARLKRAYQGAWTQSEVYPRFGTPDGGLLRIYVATETGEYSHPDERSDGLLWFMALHAFLIAQGVTAPILLVDEAERHLHYDAQADLIDVLMTQAIASKVVYTTHSVGCLPPDLGCGIRVVLAEPKQERSRIANSYWSVEVDSDDRIGYTPLLFAMGARLLSLTVPRFGVVAEGPSDAVLLPSLLRESAGLDVLPYRVVPGLSELAAEDAARLHQHAGAVACLVDGDRGGRDVRKKLVAAGVDKGSIFTLGDALAGCSVEDLVDAIVFAEAVNTEITTWALGDWRAAAAEVPDVARWNWLLDVGAKASADVAALDKTRVAQRIVDIGRRAEDGKRTQLLATQLQVPLRAIHDAIVDRLGAARRAPASPNTAST